MSKFAGCRKKIARFVNPPYNLVLSIFLPEKGFTLKLSNYDSTWQNRHRHKIHCGTFWREFKLAIRFNQNIFIPRELEKDIFEKKIRWTEESRLCEVNFISFKLIFYSFTREIVFLEALKSPYIGFNQSVMGDYWCGENGHNAVETSSTMLTSKLKSESSFSFLLTKRNLSSL